MPLFGANMVYQVSPTAYQQKGADWMKWNMVGTGPYKQWAYQKDVHLKAVRNEDYWDKSKPYLMEVDYLFVAEELTRNALFKTGGAEVLNTNRNGRVASEFKAMGYPVFTQPAGTSGLIPDSANADSPWANPKVRAAAEYAIDKEAIAKALGFGFWQPAYQFPSKESPAYIPTITGRKYDPAKAKELLKEAGFPAGFKSKIIAESSANRDVVVAIQSAFKQVGIEVELDFPEPAKFVTYRQGTWNNALLYVQVGQAPNYNQAPLGHMLGVPPAQYKSKKNPEGWEKLYNATMQAPEMDPKLQQACVQLLYDDVTMIPVTYQYDMWAATRNVQDSGIGTRGGGIYWNPDNVWLSK
jgi:peptide/nickel transport system substrate-binding protein